MNNNICGGYTSVGWKKEFKNGEFVKYQDVFMFNIRSSKGCESQIAYIKDDQVDKALRHWYNRDAYLMFGHLDLYLYIGNKVFSECDDYRQKSVPNEYYLLGGKYMDVLKEITFLTLL